MKQIEILLNNASQLQRDNFAKLMDSPHIKKGVPVTTEKLIEVLRWEHDSSFWGQVVGSPKSYRAILETVAEKLEIELPIFNQLHEQVAVLLAQKQGVKYTRVTDEEIEQRICQKVMGTILENMTPAQREAFIAVIQEESKKYGGDNSLLGPGAVLAAITAGRLGGFATYMLASSSLAAISGAVGITLPFAAYTGLSTALGVALGPIGWIGAGLFALLSGGAKYEKLIPAVLYISILRNDPANKVARNQM